MTIFEKIINREIPAEIVWEDEDHLAFLDINPIQPGHTLVIPKKQISSVFEMENEAYSALFLAAKKVSQSLKKATGAKRIGLIVEGLEIDHAHIHLVPINEMGDLRKPGVKADSKQLKDMAAAIRKEIIK